MDDKLNIVFNRILDSLTFKTSINGQWHQLVGDVSVDISQDEMNAIVLYRTSECRFCGEKHPAPKVLCPKTCTVCGHPAYEHGSMFCWVCRHEHGERFEEANHTFEFLN